MLECKSKCILSEKEICLSFSNRSFKIVIQNLHQILASELRTVQSELHLFSDKPSYFRTAILVMFVPKQMFHSIALIYSIENYKDLSTKYLMTVVIKT